MGHLPQNRIPMVKEVAKIQSIDAYSAESGIEDSDIVIAIHTHNLLESDDFEEIMREVQQQIQENVQRTMHEMRARMQQPPQQQHPNR